MQLGCARLILDNCPFAELRQLLKNFISVILEALKAFKDIIQDYLKEPPKGKGKAKAEERRQPLSFREFAATAQVDRGGDHYLCTEHVQSVVEVIALVKSACCTLILITE